MCRGYILIPAAVFTAKQLKEQQVPLTETDMFDYDLWLETFNMYMYKFTNDSVVYAVKVYASIPKLKAQMCAMNSKIVGGGITSSIEADLLAMSENTSGDIDSLVTDLSYDQEMILAMYDMGCHPDDDFA